MIPIASIGTGPSETVMVNVHGAFANPVAMDFEYSRVRGPTAVDEPTTVSVFVVERQDSLVDALQDPPPGPTQTTVVDLFASDMKGISNDAAASEELWSVPRKADGSEVADQVPVNTPPESRLASSQGTDT